MLCLDFYFRNKTVQESQKSSFPSTTYTTDHSKKMIDSLLKLTLQGRVTIVYVKPLMSGIVVHIIPHSRKSVMNALVMNSSSVSNSLSSVLVLAILQHLLKHSYPHSNLFGPGICLVKRRSNHSLKSLCIMDGCITDVQ